MALVYRVNGGPEVRIPLKSAQGAREVRGSTLFEPATVLLTPAAGRPTTSRPTIGTRFRQQDRVSRTLYLVVQDLRHDTEEYLWREHEIRIA